VSDPSIQSVPGLNTHQIETRAYKGRLGVVGIKHTDSGIQGTYSCHLSINASGQQSRAPKGSPAMRESRGTRGNPAGTGREWDQKF
jgi:hypothetical protein